MDSQPRVYSKNTPVITIFQVNSGFTFNKMSFGELLKKKMDVEGVKAAELARRSGVSKQYIGKIINHTAHSITDAPPKPEPDIIEKLADGLGWNIDEARVAAGYAPLQNLTLPEPLEFKDFDGLEKIDLIVLKKYAQYLRVLKKLDNKSLAPNADEFDNSEGFIEVTDEQVIAEFPIETHQEKVKKTNSR